VKCTALPIYSFQRTLDGLQVDSAKFVRREGARLVLDGKPFYFAGFCNYYMLTRAADQKGSGRKEVRYIQLRSGGVRSCRAATTTC